MLSFYVLHFYFLSRAPFLERFACIEVHRGCCGFHVGLFFLFVAFLSKSK